MHFTNAGDGTKRIEDCVVNDFGVVVEKATLGAANEAPVFYSNPATGNSKITGEASPDFINGLPDRKHCLFRLARTLSDV